MIILNIYIEGYAGFWVSKNFNIFGEKPDYYGMLMVSVGVPFFGEVPLLSRALKPTARQSKTLVTTERGSWRYTKTGPQTKTSHGLRVAKISKDGFPKTQTLYS